MMLSVSAAKGVATRCSLIRNTPTRSMSSRILGSRSRRCATAASASKRTFDPLTLEDLPAIGSPLYRSRAYAHTATHETRGKARREAGTRCSATRVRSRLDPRHQGEARHGCHPARDRLEDGDPPVPHVRGEEARAPDRAPGHGQ